MASEHSTRFIQYDLPTCWLSIFDGMKRNSELCDVKLKVEDTSFPAHRLILAATIPYFRSMFTEGFIESRQHDITLKGIDSDALELLINFAYTGSVEINTSNVQTLFEGSSILQLNQVQEACCNFLKERLLPCNVLGVRALADIFECSALFESTNCFIVTHFNELIETDEFMNLQCLNVKEIISRDRLNITSEEQVYGAVISWVKGHSSRHKELHGLLTKVGLHLLPPQFLANCVVDEELIRTSQSCRDLLDEAQAYQLMPKNCSLSPHFRTLPRFFPVPFIYAVGGYLKNNNRVSCIELYDPRVGEWKMANSMPTPRIDVLVTVLQNKLYVISGCCKEGSSFLTTVEVFDPLAYSWTTSTPIKYPKRAIGAVTLLN